MPCVRGNAEPPEDGRSEQNAINRHYCPPENLCPPKHPNLLKLGRESCSSCTLKVLDSKAEGWLISPGLNSSLAPRESCLLTLGSIWFKQPSEPIQETAQEVREMRDLSSKANIVCPKSEDSCLFQEEVMLSAVPSAVVRLQ